MSEFEHKDLIVKNIIRTKKEEPCPTCSFISKVQSTGTRKIKEIGVDGKSVVLNVKFSKHRCIPCNKIFSLPMEDLAAFGSGFSNTVRRFSVELISKKKMTLKKASEYMGDRYLIKVPKSTIHDWVVEDTY
jgi:hypothetical protein